MRRKRGKQRGAKWRQGQAGGAQGRVHPTNEGLQQGGCHLPMPNVSRCPPATLPMTPASPGHLADPLVGVVGKTNSSQCTSKWMWHFKERDQVKLALLCRMSIWSAEFSGHLRDRFTSVMGELQNHKTPPSQHSIPTSPTSNSGYGTLPLRHPNTFPSMSKHIPPPVPPLGCHCWHCGTWALTADG